MAQRLHEVRQSAHGACHTHTLQLSGDVQGIRRTSVPRGHPSHLAIQALRGKALRRFPEHITCSTHVVVADQGTEQPKGVFFGARRTWAGVGTHSSHVAATRRTDKSCAIAHDILRLVLEHALHRLRIAQLSIVRSEPPKRCGRRAVHHEPLDQRLHHIALAQGRSRAQHAAHRTLMGHESVCQHISHELGTLLRCASVGEGQAKDTGQVRALIC